MSVDQVKAFMAKVKADEALAKKLSETQAAYKGDKDAAVAAVIVPIAAEAGFKFTADDVKAFFNKNETEGEASDDELEAVAGGYSCTGIGCQIGCALVTW